MSLERHLRVPSPAKAKDTPKRATPSQTTEQVKSNLQTEIKLKKAELASLQNQAIAAEDAEAEPSKTKLLYKQF